jgi:hypothetical protein
MVDFIAGVLILIGFLTVAAACGVGLIVWLGESREPAPDPYRDGLDAAARISGMAFEAERTIQAVAEEEHRREEG